MFSKTGRQVGITVEKYSGHSRSAMDEAKNEAINLVCSGLAMECE
jgi:hypothetical protein